MIDHDWDAPDSEQLATARAKALEILRDPDTPRKVTAFYDPTRNYAGATFHMLPPTDRDQLSSSDLLSVTLMNVAVQPAAVRRLLDPGKERDAVAAALERVPADVSLADADELAMNAAASFYQTVKASLRGNKWVTASKIAARKRPALIPVRDRVVVAELELPNKDFQGDWTLLRGLVRDAAVQEASRELAAEATSMAPSLSDLPLLRLLDTAVWMHSREVPELASEDESSE